MSAVSFDTLGYFEKLKTAGVPEAQAKIQVEAMQDIIKTYDESSRKDIATKGDIQDLRNATQSDIQDLRNATQSDIQDLRNEIQDVKHEILKWMMGMFVAQAALFFGVVAFLLK